MISPEILILLPVVGGFLGSLGRALAGVFTLGLSELFLAPKPEPPAPPQPAAGTILTPQQLEDAQRLAVQEELKKRRKARLARTFFTESDGLVPSENQGKPQLLGS
jgi:hypothetical protein